MLVIFAFLQIDKTEAEVGSVYFQQGGAPPHFQQQRLNCDDFYKGGLDGQGRYNGRQGGHRSDSNALFYLVVCKKHFVW